MLQACSSSIKPSVSIEPPADLAASCRPLPQLTAGTGKVVLPWALKVVDQYNDCAKRHDALVKAWPKE